jgi:hypothetical protein
MQPFVIPIWLLAIDAGADWITGRWHRAPAGPVGPRWAMAGAVVVSAAVVAGTIPHPPASITSVDFARQAWVAAGPAVTADSVHGVLVQPATPDDTPIAEVIADQALRSGKAVSVPAQYVYLFDPSFRDHGGADLEVIVCCSAAFPLHEPGTIIAGYVNGNVPILVRRLPRPAPTG